MTDIKETIQGLYALKTYFASIAIEQHGQVRESLIAMQKVIDSAVTLLKEREAVEPRMIDGKRNHFIKCGNCNYDLVTGFQFCPHCGREVMWDD